MEKVTQPGEFHAEEVARLRIALARISRMVDRASADAGYTRTQLSVLGAVVRLREVGMTDLAELEGLNPTMLSRVVSKLEAAGLIIRGAGEADRRAVLVRPTPAGRALHLRLRKRRTELFVRQLAQLPPEQATGLLAALPALEGLADQLHADAFATRPRQTPAPVGAPK